MRTETAKKYSDWIHLGFYGGLQKLSVVLFGMLSTMILAHRAIEPPEMGVWSLFLILTAFVEIIRHGLVKNSLIKYLNSGKQGEKSLILSSALLLNVFITLLVGAILFLGASSIAKFLKATPLENMIYLYGIGLLFLIPFSHFEWLMNARLNFKGLFWMYVSRQSITLLLLLVSVLFHFKITLNLLVLFYSVGIIFGVAAGCVFNRSSINFRFIFSADWVKRLWHFGKYAFGTGLSNLVFRSTDAFMVSNLLASTSIVAQQGIAIRVFNLADIPSQVIGDILFPKSSGLEPDNKERIKLYYEKSVGAALAIILPAVFFVLIFPEVPVLIIAGPKYLNAIPYLQLLMFVSIFLSFLKQFGTIIDSTGRPRINFLITTLVALINLVFCFLFIKEFGLIGAAYGLLCTHVVAFLVSQGILFRLYQIRFFNSFKYAFMFYPEIGKIVHAKLFKR